MKKSSNPSRHIATEDKEITAYTGLRGFIEKYRMFDEDYRYFFISICLFIISLFALLKLVIDYIERGGWNFDFLAISFVYKVRGPALTILFKIITFTGSPSSVLIIGLVITAVLFYRRRKRDAVFFSVNVLGVWLFNELLKFVFKRQRPSDIWLVNAKGYSFPSGHTMVSIGLVLLLCYLIVTSLKNKIGAYVLCMFIVIYAVTIGLSRVYLGVHYLSDVLGGWAAGTLWASLGIIVYKLLLYRKEAVSTD